MVCKKSVKCKRSRKISRRSNKRQRGGAVRMPSEYFGGNGRDQDYLGNIV